MDIITRYAVPAIYASFTGLAVGLAVLTIFRIRDPNIRIFYLFLPLLRPYFILTENVYMGNSVSGTAVIWGGLRIPDPHNIFDNFNFSRLVFSSTNYYLLFLAVVTIGLIIVYRWVYLYVFYKRLASDEKVGSKDLPSIFSIIDTYRDKLGIKQPEVSLTHKPYYSPFVIGIKKPSLVIAPQLIECLNPAETEVVIAHELSHIKRHDSLIRWAALILRDMMFFSPFAHLSYGMIKMEQEKGSDQLVLKHSGKEGKTLAMDILTSIRKMKELISSQNKRVSNHLCPFSPQSALNLSKLRHRIDSLIKTDLNQLQASVAVKVIMAIIWVLILLLQFMIVINTGNYTVILR
ncbi:MAG: M56 family metallopeptidase [Actinomycetia bacterium]|nr:M56 family metallopeptidase [Actinomycetes bacterium]